MRALMVLAALALVSSAARGDTLDPRKMEEYRKTLVKQLEQVDKGLEKASTKNGGSALKSAHGLMDDIERTINSYEDNAKDDEKGEQNVKDWRYVHRQVEGAIKDLVVMQARQHEQDAGPKVCADAEAKLRKSIEDEVDKANSKGTEGSDARTRAVHDAVKKIKADAEALKKMVTGGVDKFDDHLKALDRTADQLKGFRARSDEWGKIDEELGIQAASIFGYYQDANRKVHGACAKIMAGEDNPDVKAILLGIERATRTGRDAAGEAAEDYDNWIERLRVIRTWHEEGEEAIRKALCEADEGADDIVVLSGIEDVVNDVIHRLAGEWKIIEHDGNALLATLKDPKRATDVKKKMASIGRSLKSRILRGTNNPVIRARVEIGKKGHLEYQRATCPGSMEVTLGNGKRIDCVVVHGNVCEVIEVKPDTVGGKKRAPVEAADYVKMIEKQWKDDRASFKKGSDVEIFLQCESGDALNLKPVPAYYPFCPATFDVEDTGDWDLK